MTLFWNQLPLSPYQNATIACTATSDVVAIPVNDQGSAQTLQVANVGTKEAFIKFGISSATTAAAGGTLTLANDGDTSVPAGAILSFTVTNAITHAAGICAAGNTTTLRLCRGLGQ